MSGNGREARFKLLVVGVGGQGALTATHILGEAALCAGFPVVVGQLHGMSQRGGSVECSVLIGEGSSSYIGDRAASVVLALEPLEALRALPKISPRTKLVVNLGTIVPFSLAVQGAPYPPVENILATLRQATAELYQIDGPALVEKTGVPRTLNVVMLGALAGLDMLPFGEDVLWDAFEKRLPRRFLQPNREAFELGLQAVRGG